jgi:pimeloyl-ACP methyl ester carboxylesterase
MIFAHGLGGSHLSWWQQVPHFADRFTCVTFAHRGFLPSTHEGAPLSPDFFADDLLGLMDHLGLADAVLVGQSMGGWCCLEAVLRAPERVRAVVMSATSGAIEPRRAGNLGDWAARAEAEAGALMARGIHPAMGARGAREQPALHLLYRHIDDSAGLADKQALRARLLASRTRGPDALDALQRPMLFLDGAEDIVFPPDAARALGERIRRPAVIVPACGHSPYFERAAVFNSAVDAFLRTAL